MKSLALLLLLQSANPAPSLHTAQRTEAVGFIAVQYYALDAAVRRCVTVGAKDEAWRAYNLGKWSARNQAELVSARTYMRRFLDTMEATERAQAEQEIRQATRANVEQSVDKLFARYPNAGHACDALNSRIVNDKLNLAAQLGESARDLVEATAMLVDPADKRVETLPFPVFP